MNSVLHKHKKDSLKKETHGLIGFWTLQCAFVVSGRECWKQPVSITGRVDKSNVLGAHMEHHVAIRNNR